MKIVNMNTHSVSLVLEQDGLVVRENHIFVT